MRISLCRDGSTLAETLDFDPPRPVGFLEDEIYHNRFVDWLDDKYIGNRMLYKQ